MKFGLTEHVIDKLLQVFSSVAQVEEAILYGSRAKGNFRNGSDIDLVLKGKNLDLQVMNKLSEQLDDLLLPYTLDVSVYKQITDPDLLDHIRRVGVLFYKKKLKDPSRQGLNPLPNNAPFQGFSDH